MEDIWLLNNRIIEMFTLIYYVAYSVRTVVLFTVPSYGGVTRLVSVALLLNGTKLLEE